MQEAVSADTLSCVNVVTPPARPATLAAHQVNDPELLHLYTSKTALRLGDILLDGVTLVCDTSTGTPRPFVPSTLRKQLFGTLHQLAHPGVRGTQRLISLRYV